MIQLQRTDEKFSFELVSYDDHAQISSCLTDGSCLAAIDYNYLDTLGSNSLTSTTDLFRLPILDDPVLTITLPQYGQAMVQSILVASYWFVGVFAYFVIFILFITSREKFRKPIRADIRTTPLSIKNRQSVALFAPPEEDVVYAGIRKAN